MGFTVDLKVNIRDQGYVGARYDVLNVPRWEHTYSDATEIDHGGTHHALYLTARLGSKPALWGSGVLTVGVLALVAIFLVGGGYS